MVRYSVRGIIEKGGGIVLIHRIKYKDGKTDEYYVFPGGGVEEGENYEECIVREMKEELGIKVKPTRQIYQSSRKDRVELFYLCEHLEGEIGTGVGPEFTSERYADRGKYLPEVIKFDELKNLNVQPAEVRGKLVEDLETYQNLKDITTKLQIL